MCGRRANATALASSGVAGIVIRAFGGRTALSMASAEVDSSASLSTALLSEQNAFHRQVVQLLRNVATSGLSYQEIALWIQSILRQSVMSSSNHRLRSQSTIASELTLEHEQSALQPADQASAAPALLWLFVELASPTTAHATRSARGVRFDASTDGFAYLQIPEVHSRSLATSAGAASASPSSSIPSFSNVLKVWPPADGYTVMLWFRIDALETKDERERLYRECFLARTCFLCSNSVRDETVLKCSHRACRACVDALLLSGGECVICNPPMFYLFRFRSSDAKSVSEAFVKGARVSMRTSASRTVHQFSHVPLAPHRWHHAAFVHARQRFQSSSVSFYLDGILQETVKMSCPSSITSGQPLSGLVGIPSQARRRSSAAWTVRSFYLIDEPVAAFAINTVFAAGPRYDGLFGGATGTGEVAVCFDHLSVPNLALIDEYMRDPLRALIESVDAERVSKNSFLRGSLSLASAASSAAAAIVQDLKAGASVFARIPSAAPLLNVPIHQDHVLLAYSSQNAVGDDASVVPNSRLDGRPIAQLMGGADARASVTISDALFELCSSGCQVAYVLLERARTAAEVELALRLLWRLMHGHAQNLDAMEQEHGYGIVNYLLHQKAALLTTRALATLFQIVGIAIDDDVNADDARESSIRNLLALQHFVLDYSLWQKVDTETQKRLFSSLYSCLVAGDDDVRERNRAQLQSLSVVRQLLYVFLDPNVEPDVLRVIVDLILVCLTGAGPRDASLEANFADVAAFLTSALSPKFAHASSKDSDDATAPPRATAIDAHASHSRSSVESAIATLCLSPRGGKRQSHALPFFGASSDRARFALPDADSSASRSRKWRAHQVKVQDLLLDMLLKAVQKHDLKESKDRDEADGTVPTPNDASPNTAATTKFPSSAAASGLATASRIQLPSSHRLTGLRKVLSPRWMSYFLFPSTETLASVPIAPTTVTLALKLLCALLSRPRYEAFFKREGYYRLLAHGLPSSQRAFASCELTGVGSSQSSSRQGAGPFPFDEMWYALFCIVLGTPVDGIPHRIQFEMFYLTKDFELNVASDRILNASIVCVILSVVRRHYDDPVAMAALEQQCASESHMQHRYPDARKLAMLATSLSTLQVDEPVFHLQVLAFLRHLYVKMPSFQRLLASSSSDKFRLEFLEELALVICAATRRSVMEQHVPSEKRVYQTLLNEKRDLNAYEAACCAIRLAETAAAADATGRDPFTHATAASAFRLLIDVLMTFLLDVPRGSDTVETFLESALGADLSPPLHESLCLHFQSRVLEHLIAEIRDKVTDEAILTDHKLFASNLREFLKLALQKMHTWQRAQHGDGCPAPFACCSSVHFASGPAQLLELVLFILAETSVGILSGSSSSGFSMFASTSTLGGLLQEKLAKGKKRRQIRQIMGRMSLSKPAELESLLESLYATLNGVVLHMLQGHRAEMTDVALASMLQLVHVHRDVVLGSRNSQDKSFFVCLCRYLLQLLSDASPVLQEAAVHVWVDLLYFQRSFMVELLTIEIRRTGMPPYSVNLMKSGFDALLECPSTELAASEDGSASDTSTLAIHSPAFAKFSKWLDLVGPPLKELEITLDRTFLKSVVESKELVRDAWVAHHKRTVARASKHARRFQTRYAWLAETDRTLGYSLAEMQQKECRRQVKWRQDRVDRQKFIARQWQHVQLHLLQHALGGGISIDDAKATAMSTPALMEEIAASSASLLERPSGVASASSWRLDFTEGPFRMRKRFLKVPQRLHGQDLSKRSELSERLGGPEGEGGSNSVVGEHDAASAWKPVTPLTRHSLRRRRFSESDLTALARAHAESSGAHGLASPSAGYVSAAMDSQRARDGEARETRRRGSFEDLKDTRALDDASSIRSSYSVERRRDSQDSGVHDHDDDDGARDDVEHSATFVQSGGDASLTTEDDAVDEKLRPLLMPGDEITDIYDCLRIDGMDSCPGVFLLCNDHAYIVDNYQRVVTQQRGLGRSATELSSSQTRVVEISHGSTTRLERGLSLRHHHSTGAASWNHSFSLHTPSSSASSSLVLLSRSSFTHQCRFWSYDDIVELHKRRYQLRHVAIEIFAHDGRNYLVRLSLALFRQPEAVTDTVALTHGCSTDHVRVAPAARERLPRAPEQVSERPRRRERHGPVCCLGRLVLAAAQAPAQQHDRALDQRRDLQL